MRRRVQDPGLFGRVAVLAGGWSAEREVSLWSGEGVLKALLGQGVNASLVDPLPEDLFGLRAQGFQRVFNVLHGTGGEDGTVQAVLDLLDLPYTGSGVMACALAMDKLRTKRLWREAGLPVPADRVLEQAAQALPAAQALGYPLFIKPAAEGSSVGVTKVKSADQLEAAFALAAGEQGRLVMAEACIGGGEYTCAIVDGEALPVIRIEPEGEFYDYRAKYLSDRTLYHCPAGLPPADEQAFRALCLRAFEVLAGRGWGRIDFLLDGDGRPFLLEANLVPGMTSHSLVPIAAAASGMDYPRLCWTLLETTLRGSP